MNKIWSFIVVASLITLTFYMPDMILPTILNASNSALTLSLELLAIYAVWLGIINILENTPISNKISKLLSPVIDKLWSKDLSSNAKRNLSLSISSSLLGIGGASVPLGIKAVEEMDDKTGTINFPIIITILFASAGLQFIPTTIMSMMTVAGSVAPAKIVLPSLLAGIVTTFSGIGIAHLINHLSKRRKKT